MKRNKLAQASLSALMGIVICGVLLAGCGGGSGSTGSNVSGCTTLPKLAKKAHYKVGFSQEVTDSPWRVTETSSIKDEATKRGDQVIVTDAQNSDSKQVSDIQSLIAQHPDVLIIAPLTEKGEVSAIKQAKAACIPVILVDRDADHSIIQPGKDYVTFIGSDFVQQGKRAADWLIQATHGKAKIIELEGTTGSTPANLRKKGFNDEIASNSGMQIIASQDANFERATALKTMQTLLQSHPDVTAVYAHNDEMAMGAIQALKAAGKHPGKDVLVCSIDGENDALKAIMSGEEGTSVQSNPRFGPISFDTIDKYASGQSIEPWIVIKDNQYTKENATQAFNQGLGF
ncbi:ABC transporter substrate-binding protein [Ktedonosporobacter rubrisoli]|uniref:ABC transporter substrate-binding protein n=1 Tax=Ktedonosporobacter rubrisoli TaxID=2509675 RepID=A0A4P6JX96_KTERU|nr:ABC transporter substrate-binding protein [Ktedonosporobacter rubrisoli]QBD80042.1 ABC transporter substrate-binding protein [Ktedonosporobacter rubrisoli]